MTDETSKPTWTQPRTWVAGELVTAAHLNEIRDSLIALHTRVDRPPLKLGEGQLDDNPLG